MADRNHQADSMSHLSRPSQRDPDNTHLDFPVILFLALLPPPFPRIPYDTGTLNDLNGFNNLQEINSPALHSISPRQRSGWLYSNDRAYRAQEARSGKSHQSSSSIGSSEGCLGICPEYMFMSMSMPTSSPNCIRPVPLPFRSVDRSDPLL